MDSMIKEINENLRAIIDTLKSNMDNSISTLDNIQIQMDKKVEEAKKYKIQVDSAKENIKSLEDENKSLELSLNELSDKYGKMNLVSVVEAGNREIKNKINDNLKEINKQKEHIAELTNRARTIKDLLINLKKDKTIKEERLENVKVVYSYYNDRINEIVDYAFDHSENLMDYKNKSSFVNFDEETEEEYAEDKNIELENTMVFDEIANIDDNKNFKDEMTFISDQIENTIEESDSEISKIDDIIKKSLESEEVIEDVGEEFIPTIEEPIDSTQVFNNILNNVLEEENTFEDDSFVEEKEIEETDNNLEDSLEEEKVAEIESEPFTEKEEDIPTLFSIGEENEEENSVLEELEDNLSETSEDVAETGLNVDNSLFNNLNISDELVEQNEDEVLDEENESRINKINDLFSNFENNTISLENVEPVEVKGIEEKIDDAYMDIFGKPLNSEELNKKESTLTDIFGNPVSNDELSNETKLVKKIEELFVENGIDFNKFREDEKNYLKQIYNEDKFNNIISVLKKNKINLDNIYSAFNIFGEINEVDLEELISKLVNIGQSVEAIGLILEKLPKIKKYNLDEAIMSFGEYIKDIDITELVIKAKELYKNGGNS